MTFYITLWVIMLVFGIQYNFTHKLPSKNIFLFLTFALAVIVGARSGDIGADTANYIDFYDTGVAPDKLSGSYEPLFMLLRFVCYKLGFTHNVFFFILSFVSLYIWYVVAEKLKLKNYYLAFFVYFSMVFLSYQFNTVRNGVMASFVWLSFAYNLEGKTWKSLIIMLVAAGFHAVALAFIPLLFILNKDFSRKIVITTLVVVLLCYFLRLGDRLISMFPILGTIDRVAGYVELDEDKTYGITLGTIVNISLFLFMYLFYNRIYKESLEYRLVLNMMLMAIVVVCVCNSFQAIVTRIGQVLNLSLMFVWPFFIDRLKKTPLQIGASILLCAYLWLYYSKGLEAIEIFSGRLAYIPYVWDFTGIFR